MVPKPPLRRPPAPAAPAGAAAIAALALAGLLTLAGCGGSPPALDQAAEAAARYRCDGCNLLLVSIDTLRADHLGAYGYGRDTSPNLDRLAASSVVFERAYSVSYHTADSHMSAFTSLYPAAHMVQNAGPEGARPLAEGIETLAEVLARHGYRTAGFHGGGNIGPVYGFDRGYELYRRSEEVGPAIEWLEAQPGDRPFLLFFHTYHPHDPYTPEPPFDTLFDPGYEGDIVSDHELLGAGGGKFRDLRDRFWSHVDPDDPRDIAHVQALYDGEIREIDRDLGPLFAAAAATARPTVVIVFSDHGEEFYEHGRFIHDQLYEELLRVPLIVHRPGVAQGRRIAPRVSLIDLAPTVLDLLALPPSPQHRGSSLLPVIGGAASPAALIFAEKVRPSRDEVPPGPFQISNVALIEGDAKLIVQRRPELFDLAADPDEQHDLTPADPERVRRMRRLTGELERQSAAAREEYGIPWQQPAAALDRDTRRQLEALGYLR